MTDDGHARFNAAFPWFDHKHWAWSRTLQEPLLRGAQRPGRRVGQDRGLHGGRDHEQWQEVKQWLLREFKPRYSIPATRLLPKKQEIVHRHSSTWGEKL